MNTHVTLLSDLWFDEHTINTMAYLFQKKGITPHHLHHKIERNNQPAAAYYLRSVLNYYDANTWHINYVGLEDLASPLLVIEEHADCMIASINNGFLSLVNYAETPQRYIFDFSDANGVINHFTYTQKIIALIQSQNDKAIWEQQSVQKDFFVKINPPTASIFDNMIKCSILTMKHNDSIVLNITKQQFEEARKGRNFFYEYAPTEKIDQIVNNPHEVDSSESYMLFNHADYLEIGVRGASFARLVNAERNLATDYKDIGFIRQKLARIEITIYFI